MGVILLPIFSSLAMPKAKIQAYCSAKATNASDKCIGAGMSADYCADIANRTYNNSLSVFPPICSRAVADIRF